MSADRWSQCPRCKDARITAAVAADERVSESYGKVSISEFDELRAEATRA